MEIRRRGIRMAQQWLFMKPHKNTEKVLMNNVTGTSSACALSGDTHAPLRYVRASSRGHGRVAAYGGFLARSIHLLPHSSNQGQSLESCVTPGSEALCRHRDELSQAAGEGWLLPAPFSSPGPEEVTGFLVQETTRTQRDRFNSEQPSTPLRERGAARQDAATGGAFSGANVGAICRLPSRGDSHSTSLSP